MVNKFNKKYILFCGVLFLAVFAIVIISVISWKNGDEKIQLTKYNLILSFDEEKHLLTGEEEVCYVNNYDNAFSSLYFHLYPNAFREGAISKVVSSNNESDAYPNGKSYGDIEIVKVCYKNGDEAKFNICGEDENILEVVLQEDLYPDEKVEIIISFKTTLANINHRLGYGENTVNFGNFYPIACVYEEGKGFSQSLYHSNGDPFYSECANYEVEISYPSSFEIASSGNQNYFQKQEDNACVKYTAEKVRDFCFVLSKKFEKVCEKVNGVSINYYGYKGDADLEKCLNTCKDALITFEDMYGKYPYPQLSIVKSNFIHGGMEFPNIVLISEEIFDEKDINYVIVHEIAHQWWYGLVGNDQYNNAWMDEGLAEYSTLLFFKQNPDYKEDFNQLVDGAVDSYKLFEEVYVRVTGKVDGRMQRPLCDFQTEPEYVQCTYTKGVIMFNTIREMVGDKKFFATLRNYLEDYKFKIASPAHLIAQFVSSCGKSMEGFFYSWLEGKVVLK